MEVLHSARRLGFDTELHWLVYDDDGFTNVAITVDGQRINIDPTKIEQYYTSNDGTPLNIRLSHKADYTPQPTKSEHVIEEPKTDIKPKKKSNKKKKVEPKPDIVPKTDDTTTLNKGYNKVLYNINDGKGFSIDVDGSYDDAIKLKNEISRGRELTIQKLTILTHMSPVDTYYILEHYRDGKLFSDIDYEQFVDADRKRQNILQRYPNDVVNIYHVDAFLE